MPDAPAPDGGHERVVVEQRVQRVAGDVRDLGGQVGAVRARPRGRRTSAGRRTAAPSAAVVRRSQARTAPAGAARRGRRPAAPASGRSSRGGRGRRRRCRAAARGTCRAGAAPSTSAAGSTAAKSAAPARCRRTGRGCSTSTAVDACGRRRGPRGRAGRPRPRGAQARSGLAQVAERRRASSAMASVGRLGGLLLGLLLRPAGAVAVEPVADPHLRGEGLLVVGALVLDDVLGDAERVARRRAPGGWSSSPGRRRGRAAFSISGSKSRCTTAPAASKPPLR